MKLIKLGEWGEGSRRGNACMSDGGMKKNPAFYLVHWKSLLPDMDSLKNYL